VLDPRTNLVLLSAKLAGSSFRPDISVRRFRNAYALMNRLYGLHGRYGVRTSELRIMTDDGTIAARAYRPLGAAGALPALLYFHGGGFVIGDVASYDPLAYFLAREGQLTIVSVEYRLGPEHRFPRAHEDAFAALAWVRERAAGLQIDPDRLAVGGDSAGGGLAAALSALAETRGLQRPALQLLIYPSLDRAGTYPSFVTYGDDLPITMATSLWFRDHYVNSLEDVSDFRLSPLRAPQPERLPETYLLAAQYDLLLDEGKAYARRLRDAGVPVVYDLRETLSHAFVNIAGFVPAARVALRDAIRYVGGRLHNA